MRILYLLMGEPGSGKSTFIEKNKKLFDGLTISSDALRVANYGLDLHYDDGILVQTISNRRNNRVFNILKETLHNRTDEGLTTVVDTTHLYKGAFQEYRQIKKKDLYRVYVVDFTGKSKNELLEINKQRSSTRDYVPEEAIAKFHDRAQHAKDSIPREFTIIKPEEVASTMQWHEDNLNGKFRQVKVIGDVHGCYTVLKEAFPELNKDTLYVFCGDYLDRGIENYETFKWFYEHCDDDNVVLLRGNHELHWDKYVKGEKVTARQTLKTFAELELHHDFNVKKLSKLRRHLQDAFAFKLNGEHYLVTHAGLPYQLLAECTQENEGSYTYLFNNLPETVFTKGIGEFSMDVDANYEHAMIQSKTSYELPVQIHGHRNRFEWDNEGVAYSYNLEQKVESGGSLAVWTLNAADPVFNEIEYPYVQKFKNHVYRLDNVAITKPDNVGNSVMLDYIKENKFISTHAVAGDLFVSNLTSDALDEKNFDKLSITARGLFTDSKGNVQGRGFNKFFEIDSHSGLDINDLVKDKAKFPATASEKMDGFLSISFCYDGHWVVESKGGSPEYGMMAENAIMKAIALKGEEPERTRARLDKWFADNPYVSILCEIILHKKDAHIVIYPEDQVYLLQAISNKYEEQDLPEVKMDFATKFSVSQPRELSLTTPEDLYKLYKISTDRANPLNYNKEGWVITFADGSRVKLKNAWYHLRKEFMLKLSTAHKFGSARESWIPEVTEAMNRLQDAVGPEGMKNLPLRQGAVFSVIDVDKFDQEPYYSAIGADWFKKMHLLVKED